MNSTWETQDPDILYWNPVINGLDNYPELIGPPVISNLSTLMSGFTLFFLVQENEFQDLEKPDGLRFVRGAQIEHFGNGLITPKSLVLILNKGA